MIKAHKYIKSFSLLLFLFCLISVNNAEAQTVEKGDEGQKTVELHRVKAKYICMMGNELFDTKQVPMEIKGKTYYGFCPGCLKALKQKPKARFAIDPVSGERVNKAKAVLAATPKGHIYYFESMKNMKKFEPTRSQIRKRFGEEADKKGDEEQKMVELHRVNAKYICMVSNQLLEKKQFPAKIKGKTYYGCDRHCARKLNHNPKLRFAIDPVSGERVNKAKAVLAATQGDHIYYFESVENMKKYELTINQILKRFGDK